MRIFLNSFWMILIFITLVGCGDQTIQSHKITNDISIDGNGQDWADIPLEYNEDMKVVYGITNDETSLNIMIRFSDRQLVRMFQSRGVTLWLCNKNDEDKKIGIYFVDKNMPQMGFMRERRQRPQRNEDEQKQFQLTGSFFVVREDTVPINEFEEIEAAADHIDGLYCFEFKIPFTKNANKLNVISFPEDKELEVKVEIAAVSEDIRNKMKAQMEERTAGIRGGRMPGGGLPGGGRIGGRMPGRGGRGDRSMPDFDKKEIFVRIKLK